MTFVLFKPYSFKVDPNSDKIYYLFDSFSIKSPWETINTTIDSYPLNIFKSWAKLAIVYSNRFENIAWIKIKFKFKFVRLALSTNACSSASTLELLPGVSYILSIPGGR